MDERMKQFKRAANGGRHDEAFKIAQDMEPEEIAESIYDVHSYGSGSDRAALREAVALLAEAKIEKKLSASAARLGWIGVGLAFVQVVFGALAVACR